MSGKTSGSIIDLIASWKGALDGLKLGREFAPGGEVGKGKCGRLGRDMRLCRLGGVGGVMIVFVIVIGEVIVDFGHVILIRVFF